MHGAPHLPSEDMSRAADTDRAATAQNPAPAKAKIGVLRTLAPFLGRQRGLVIAWLVALAAFSTATLSLPVAVRLMIDRGFSDAANVNLAFAVLFAVALALALATALRFFFVSLLGERVIADLRTRLYGHLMGLDQEFYERSRSGELVSRLSADTELLRGVISSGMSVALRSVITVTRTVVVNGSAFSSHTRSNRSSLLTTAPLAVSSTSSTPNSLRVSSTGVPARVTVRLAGSNTTSSAANTGGDAGVARLPSARTLATSSGKANGLPR